MSHEFIDEFDCSESKESQKKVRSQKKKRTRSSNDSVKLMDLIIATRNEKQDEAQECIKADKIRLGLVASGFPSFDYMGFDPSGHQRLFHHLKLKVVDMIGNSNPPLSITIDLFKFSLRLSNGSTFYANLNSRFITMFHEWSQDVVTYKRSFDCGWKMLCGGETRLRF